MENPYHDLSPALKRRKIADMKRDQDPVVIEYASSQNAFRSRIRKLTEPSPQTAEHTEPDNR